MCTWKIELNRMHSILKHYSTFQRIHIYILYLLFENIYIVYSTKEVFYIHSFQANSVVVSSFRL